MIIFVWLVLVVCLLGLAWALRCSYWVFFQADRSEGQDYAGHSMLYGAATGLFGIGAWWMISVLSNA